MLIQESKLKKGLPKQTESLCPECGKIITATIFEKDGKVLMEKECPDHGKITDVYWSDVDLYLKAESLAFDGVGVSNPLIPDAKVCPDDCGLCQLHLSHTSLANLDLTNRCNMKCPICFANANAAGYVYEPSYDEVVQMMQTLRDERPVPCTAIQFAGGEPTIYPRFFDVIKKAKEMGFAQVQVATNGVKLANDPDFARKCAEAGLNTIYLQFDGLREDIYVAARGKPMLETKLKAIENVKALAKPPSIVLVPTIVKGINDDQVGPILEFAIKNSDVIRGINYQPVAFTGRISKEQREKERYTLTDLVHDVNDQTGYTNNDDWFPVPVVAPISTFVSALLEEEKVTFTAHPHCGLATYLFVQNGRVIPITRFIDAEKLLDGLLELTKEMEGGKSKTLSKLKAFSILKKSIIKENLPEGLSMTRFLKTMQTVFSDDTKEGLSEFSWNMMFVGGMHFQDGYNYDIERVKRCVIHYVTPDNSIIPFCAYNGGPTYRTRIEKKYSVPIEDWRKTKGEEYT
ncbi:MAG: radical SAM protein [Methanomassiliicoccales archaeon]|nr:radical SAM protein [Methanomassiliicoccales archaeon]NYT14679.1 radical SAM protein [Methanomassiliicoccales archaeon]